MDTHTAAKKMPGRNLIPSPARAALSKLHRLFVGPAGLAITFLESNMTTEPRKPGRPAPLGRKLTACVRLTPTVDEYLRSTGGLSQVDAIVRGTKEFRNWMKENGK